MKLRHRILTSVAAAALLALSGHATLCNAQPPEGAETDSDESTDLSRCPLLPKKANLQWHFHHDGLREFDVCYATRPGSDTQLFGFYFSKVAAAFVDNPSPIGEGTVAGHEVTWFGRGDNFNVGPFSRHATIAPYRGSSDFTLVYLYADDEAQLQRRLEILRATKLR